MTILGNDPFAEAYPQRHKRHRSPRRGRAIMIAAAAGVLGTAGFLVLQQYLPSFDWLTAGDGEKPTPVRGEMPPFVFQLGRVSSPDAGTTGTAADTTPPAMEPPPPLEQRAPSRRARAQERQPSPIAFNVAMQGEEPKLDWFHDGRRPRMAPGCALRPGASVIPVTLNTTIESEIGGSAIATVTEDVPDADGYDRRLIPAGTKVYGRYQSENLSFNSRRVGIVWMEATFPDGKQVSLLDSPGLDAAGSMGVGGEVHTQWGNLIATAALLTVFDGLSRSGTPEDDSLSSSMSASASNNAGRLGKEVTRQVFSWAPKIRVPAGTPLMIAPAKTIQIC